MAVSVRYFLKGIELRPTTDETGLYEGIALVNGTEHKLKIYLDGALRKVLTEDQAQPITNKTIDLDLNTVSNVRVANLGSGVLDTDLTSVSASDDTIPSAKAVKTYIDDKVATKDQASEISTAPISGVSGSNVQDNLQDLKDQIDTKASASGLSDHINDTVDAHAASAISNVPSGNLSATDQQGVNNELQSDIDTRATTSNLNAHTSASSGVHGVVGSVVGTTDAQTVSNKNLSNSSVTNPSRLDLKKDTKANLETYALTATDGQMAFATDTQETYVIKNGLLSDVGGGGSGVGGTDIMSADTADRSALSDYTQTGLEIIETPIVLHGLKSFRLKHSTSVKSFKRVIPVDRKFRNKNITVWVDVASTAQTSNLNIIFRDETNSVDLTTSQAIATGSSAITGTTANASNQLTSLSNATIALLKVGMVITGSAIPSGTTITAIGTTSATMSQNATGVSTGIRISDLVAKKIFSFNIPANCQSLSWAISSVIEADAESYIDDIVLQLTSAVLTSTSITVPKISNEDVRYQGANLLTTTGNIRFSTTGIASLPSKLISYDQSTGYFTALKDVYISGGFTLDVASAAATFDLNVNGSFIQRSNTTPASANYKSTVGFGIKLLSGQYFNISTAAGLTNSAIDGFTFVAISNETETKTIPLTTSVLVTQPDSSIRLNTTSTYGVTGTKVTRWTNLESSIGSAIQYIADAVNGDRFVALQDGTYDISFSWCGSAASDFGITKNMTSVSTFNTSSGNTPEILCIGTTQNANYTGTVSCEVQLIAGDIIRAVADGTASGNRQTKFSMNYQGSLKQLNVSSDQKIEIPTHTLRFEGASSRGSTDTVIVKFDTLSNIRGDAWDVLNTVANGTVVTMKKAGKLTVSGSVLLSSSSDLLVTKNQTTLTAIPTIAEEIIGAQSTGSARLGLNAISDVNIGDKIRISSNATPTAIASNFISISLTENSIPANFSNVLPQWSQSDSSVRLNTANGYGSTNTRIRRFSNTVDNLGTAITYTDSASLGGYFTVNEDGNYEISYCDFFSAPANMGISKNSSQLTTSIDMINTADRLALSTTNAANYGESVSWSGFLSKNDVIRAHSDSTTSGIYPARTTFTISKVGKPNLSSVDVTSFVNLKTTESVSFRANGTPQTSYTANTPIVFTGVVEDSLKAYNTTTGQYTSPITGNIQVSYFINTNVAINTTTKIFVNGVFRVNSGFTYNASGLVVGGASVKVLKGDIIDIRSDVSWSAVGSGNNLTISFENNLDSIASPTQQVSSDTMSFAFKATAIDPATDAIGTFNTYTYASGGNVATIAGTAPTQTTSSMNTNGFQIFSRSLGSNGAATLPSRVDIFIGKGLKSKQVDLYLSSTKVDPVGFGRGNNGSSVETGADIYYSENTGILTITAGLNVLPSATRYVGDQNSAATSGYFVFNASKSPSLVTIPNLQQRIAYIKDVKAGGVGGGTSTAGVYQTRTLNTVEDTTGIITSLASNQFILPSGQYLIEASAPCYSGNAHKIRLRNITDSITSILGIKAYATASASQTDAFLGGIINLTSSKTFELQHYIQTALGTEGLGVNSASGGDDSVFSQVKITKIK